MSNFQYTVFKSNARPRKTNNDKAKRAVKKVTTTYFQLKSKIVLSNKRPGTAKHKKRELKPAKRYASQGRKKRQEDSKFENGLIAYQAM